MSTPVHDPHDPHELNSAGRFAESALTHDDPMDVFDRDPAAFDNSRGQEVMREAITGFGDAETVGDKRDRASEALRGPDKAARNYGFIAAVGALVLVASGFAGYKVGAFDRLFKKTPVAWSMASVAAPASAVSGSIMNSGNPAGAAKVDLLAGSTAGAGTANDAPIPAVTAIDAVSGGPKKSAQAQLPTPSDLVGAAPRGQSSLVVEAPRAAVEIASLEAPTAPATASVAAAAFSAMPAATATASTVEQGKSSNLVRVAKAHKVEAAAAAAAEAAAVDRAASAPAEAQAVASAAVHPLKTHPSRAVHASHASARIASTASSKRAMSQPMITELKEDNAVAGWRLQGTWPPVGRGQRAWLVNGDGKLMTVAVGDTVGTARVVSIERYGRSVRTTGGDITP